MEMPNWSGYEEQTRLAKRGSEERDYVFGRLFGIMAVVRSGSLTIAGVPIEVSLQLLSIWEGYQPCQPIFVC